tara:strand:+ start:571 stop:1044 length:474 start_codon:yes stop_codon:yes gene_type:complete
MQNKFSLLIALICTCFLLACDQDIVFEENLKLEDAKWDRDELAQFEFEIQDSSLNYAIFLHFRHGGNYPYRNIYLFTRTESPEGKIAIDTAQMVLADARGKWMGKGIGDLFDYEFKFKEGPLFPEKGTYSFTIEQAMREQTLPEITNVGVSIKQIEI